ncbi:MAG TPA: hypothetical protein VN643_12575 [Pyrinomonadaceae bacterium]|nr:hypothetical protein [Pyrinomonadaceae bacterium]
MSPTKLRLASISILLLSGLCLLSPAGKTSSQPEKNVGRLSHSLLPSESASLLSEYHGLVSNLDRPAGKTSSSEPGGIREVVPDKYRARYEEWKKEFLATSTGRLQWESYLNNPNFTLTVVVARENAEGGTTGNYKWNDSGKLVAATITLGCRLFAGVPNPVYFPVMNSLLPTDTTRRIEGETLAATKMAHEFGHVNRTAKGDSDLYQLQSQLIPKYNQIFLSNGRDASDPRLLEMVEEMKGTPVEIWEDREYWGETNAMLFLRDRFANDGFRCQLFSRIKRSVDLYAPSYEARFVDIAQSGSSGRQCGW